MVRSAFAVLGAWRRVLLVVLAGVALGACASTPPPFQASVTSLAEALSEIPSRGVYRFVEVPPAEAGRLEYRAEQDALRIGLGQVGLREQRAGETDAEILVAFTYRSEPFQGLTEVATPVIWPPLGPSPFYPYGFYGGGGWGFSMVAPTPYMYQTVPVEAWRHVLELSLRDRRDPDRELYHVRAVHESPRDDRLVILPYLVDAALEGYPQPGNQTRTVRIPRR